MYANNSNSSSESYSGRFVIAEDYVKNASNISSDYEHDGPTKDLVLFTMDSLDLQPS